MAFCYQKFDRNKFSSYNCNREITFVYCYLDNITMLKKNIKLKKINIHKHLGKHVMKHSHKIAHHAHHTHHLLSHIWELVLVLSIGFMSLMYAWSSNLPNNTSFSYPLQKVSTVECRTLYRNDMPDSCKINLPIIHWANYEAYKNNSIYRSIYTTLRAAPYSDTWNQKIWAHAWVDMATARGTPLYSIWDGEVFFAGRNSAYGNVVKIKYVYNWEIVYAVYAHMDSILVKAKQKVSKWQRIWAVWNSGNTKWKLWWYHVHFEIDKDNYGRPAYSYMNCPDLKKWHYYIIQHGACRTELFTHQYDPIKIFESNSTYVPETENKIEKKEDKKESKKTEEIIEAKNNDNKLKIDDMKKMLIDNNKDEKKEDKKEDKKENNLINKDNNIVKWKKIIVDDSNHDAPYIVDEKIDDTIKEENTIIDNIEVDDNINDVIDTEEKEVVVIVDGIGDVEEEDKNLLELDFDWINLLAQHFLSLREVEMHSELIEKNLAVGETITLDIDLFKRGVYTNLDDDQIKEVKENNKKHNWYKWILKEPFMFITSNNNIDIDINYLQLITKWKAQVKITGKKLWNSSLIIEFGWKKIWMLDINIK